MWILVKMTLIVKGQIGDRIQESGVRILNEINRIIHGLRRKSLQVVKRQVENALNKLWSFETVLFRLT